MKPETEHFGFIKRTNASQTLFVHVVGIKLDQITLKGHYNLITVGL